MKGRIRKSTQPVFRSRDPGPREMQRRHIENLYAKAEVVKPRPPVTPQKVPNAKP
jgi:hypothetical protein